MLNWLVGWAPSPEIGSHLLREEGEVIVDEVAHHWICFIKPALYIVLGALLWTVALLSLTLGWLLIVLGLGCLLWGTYLALAVHLDRFVITNMRVFRVKGVFTQSLATMPLSRILDITVTKPWIGRIFGFGHFVFESAAQAQGLREIHSVGRVDERDLTIQRVVQRAGLRGPKVS